MTPQGPWMHTVRVPRDENAKNWAEVNEVVMLGLPES